MPKRGASFLDAHAGMGASDMPNSAAYLQGWIDALVAKDRKGSIIRAASQAPKAAIYILNMQKGGASVKPAVHMTGPHAARLSWS